jgi:C1A family cysteine protease
MSYKLATVLLVALATSLVLLNMKPHHHESEFQQWKAAHGKVYDSKFEEKYRETVFNQNVAKINAHNADKTQTHQVGVNQFTDLTQEEFVSQYLTLKVNKKFANANSRTMNVADVNGDVDWVAAGKVTGVKNQAACGSCWAFSAIASLESALLVNGQAQQLFSEQQLVDCSQAYGNYGCNGGWMDSAFGYIKDHGIATQDQYPYVGRDQACKLDGGAQKVSGWVDVPGCTNLANALTKTPISVAVDASNWSSYKSGVLSTCGTAVNHGVLLVGSTGSYWTIKNSWSSAWGESGFIRINVGNTCAVCSYPSYPTL